MSHISGTDSLSYLPDIRKRIGKREHVRIYKKITSVFNDARAVNGILGGVFPRDAGTKARYVFYEVNLGRRIPDCIFVFVERDGSAACYVVEFKTTMRNADDGSIRTNRTHRLQYLQGLKQLRDSLNEFSQFNVPNGTSWKIYPVIAFFKQRGSGISFVKIFSPKSFGISNHVILKFLESRQHESVKTLSRIAVRSRVRGASGKRSSVSSGRAPQTARRKRSADAPAYGRSSARHQVAKARRRRVGGSRRRGARRV
uniref:Nuclear protein UL24 n=1 Tax=Mastomys natalensis cytomegalovirus 2 TaxID=2973540 RepID=A0A9Y1IKS4_9BETA|nr:nuclear protein UL24 [Mastomys natalensis cytomegalovirus 2]WEG69211.1 nuclear protein UL24 [Mastomys natalensis cytomegalovirus 2]WEG69350.1 nuclear protein UL24 [Mastomys natalensis cytomegalovirus 2]WEG69488.1 nuclear protein UL24 [Mastomys natalensis cytomegalovirus 2]WEG69626.1 nuclear protein UL24 [Mastomys natalensis cytomegalovirus 2]